MAGSVILDRYIQDHQSQTGKLQRGGRENVEAGTLKIEERLVTNQSCGAGLIFSPPSSCINPAVIRTKKSWNI